MSGFNPQFKVSAVFDKPEIGGLVFRSSASADLSGILMPLVVGPAGPAGASLDIISRPAAQTILPGQAVRANNLGTLVLASAASLNTCKGVMVAKTGALTSFTAEIAIGHMILPNWTDVIGSVSLAPMTDYFLSPSAAGYLTATPPTSAGEVILHVGTAIDATTLALVSSDAIAL